MNLASVANSAITAINPQIQATFSQSSGYSVDESGNTTPTYVSFSTMIQEQGIGERALSHLNSLNIGGVLRKVYADGAVSSVVRATATGGDMFIYNGAKWLVVQVNEQWPGWCSVIVQQQVS